MRFEGVLKTWNDDCGFGFIQPTQSGQEIFMHIKSFPAGSGRSALNLPLTFEVEQTAGGKKRAKSALLVRPAKASAPAKRRTVATWEKASVMALAFFALLYLGVTLTWGTPMFLAAGYVAMSLVCGLLYVHDKAAAQKNERRTPEGTHLLLGLAGGWPGAITSPPG